MDIVHISPYLLDTVPLLKGKFIALIHIRKVERLNINELSIYPMKLEKEQ